MELLSVYEKFLYYCSLMLIAQYILGCAPNVRSMCCSFSAFIILVFAAAYGEASLFFVVNIAFEIVQFLLLKSAFREVKIRALVLSYILLFCTNLIITSLVAALIPPYYLQADFVINTFTAIILAVVCFTKIRCIVRQILEWTPRYILVICALLLIAAAVASAFISGFQHFVYPQVWSYWLQVITAFLLLAICVVLPVIVLTSVSNTHLKTLTAEYEQQIHAQAAHYKDLAAANYEVRRFRHDFKNMRIAIERLLAEGDQAQALELIRQCGDTLEKPSGSRSAFNTGNGIADALLADKWEKAAACNAEILFQGVIPQERLSPTDLCVILGNTLDNAIEACEKLPPEDPKTISATGSCSCGFWFLSITNPIAEKVTVHGGSIATTKENKTLHGFGLYSLYSVVKKYDGAVRLTAAENTFTVEVDLCLMASAEKAAP